MGMQANEHSGAFTIEEVTDLDAAWPKIEPLVLGIIEYHRPWDARKLSPNWAGVMREYMQSQCTTLLARNHDGEALGFLSGTIRADFGIFEGTLGHVDNIFVVEHVRRDGIGSALCERFEAICASRGCDEVRLDVAIGNEPGNGFWRRSGYEPATQAMHKSLVSAR
jgi:ribosomal protein S18 acetylase RimI-like enzyme